MHACAGDEDGMDCGPQASQRCNMEPPPKRPLVVRQPSPPPVRNIFLHDIEDEPNAASHLHKRAPFVSRYRYGAFHGRAAPIGGDKGYMHVRMAFQMKQRWESWLLGHPPACGAGVLQGGVPRGAAPGRRQLQQGAVREAQVRRRRVRHQALAPPCCFRAGRQALAAGRPHVPSDPTHT